MSLDDRNREFEKKLENNPIDSSIAELIKDAGRRRRQIMFLGISLMLDVLLTIGFAYLSIQARDTAIEVQNSKDTLIANCQVGNEFRKTEADLWNHILEIQPANQSSLTPEQEAKRQKTIADFREYLKTTFAPRDCNNIIKD